MFAHGMWDTVVDKHISGLFSHKLKRFSNQFECYAYLKYWETEDPPLHHPFRRRNHCAYHYGVLDFTYAPQVGAGKGICALIQSFLSDSIHPGEYLMPKHARGIKCRRPLGPAADSCPCNVYGFCKDIADDFCKDVNCIDRSPSVLLAMHRLDRSERTLLRLFSQLHYNASVPDASNFKPQWYEAWINFMEERGTLAESQKVIIVRK